MKYSIEINGTNISIEISDNADSHDLATAKDILCKLIDDKIIKYKMDMLAMPINLVPDLSLRAQNVLLRAGLSTIKDVLNLNKKELEEIRNMGKRTLEDIITIIGRYGEFKEE